MQAAGVYQVTWRESSSSSSSISFYVRDGGELAFKLATSPSGAWTRTIGTGQPVATGIATPTPSGSDRSQTVTIVVGSSGDARVWLWDGKAWVETIQMPAGWFVKTTALEVYGGTGIGGLTVRRWDAWTKTSPPWTDGFTPTARYRVGFTDLGYATTVATQSVRGRPAREVIAEIASALCATVHIDAYGVLTWESADWVGAQWEPRTSVNLSSLDDLLGLRWESTSDQRPRAVVIKHGAVTRSWGNYRGDRRGRAIVWVADPIELAANQTWSAMIAPDDDEDWIDLDLAQDDGTGCGITVRHSAGTSSGRSTPYGSRQSMLIERTAGPAGAKLYDDAGPTPVVRARERLTWVDVEVRTDEFGPDGAADIVHDTHRWVHPGRTLNALIGHLVGALKSPKPRIQSMQITPRIDLRLGDRVVITDDHAAGVQITGNVRKIDLSVRDDEITQAVEVDVLTVTTRAVRPLGT